MRGQLDIQRKLVFQQVRTVRKGLALHYSTRIKGNIQDNKPKIIYVPPIKNILCCKEDIYIHRFGLYSEGIGS